MSDIHTDVSIHATATTPAQSRRSRLATGTQRRLGSSVLVRSITENDIEPLIEFAQEMVGPSVYGNIPFSPSRTKWTMEQMINKPTEWCGFVAMDGDQPVGFIGAYLNMYLFSTRLVAYDCVYIIAPQYRTYKLAYKLIDVYRQWAKKNKADLAHVTVSFDPSGRIEKLMTKLGFVANGTRYAWRVE